MTRSFIASVVLVACLSATSLLAADFTVGHLRCEYLKDPLGLDEIHPRLSWQLHSEERGIRQTAYQIQVASSPEALANGRADLWDSGKVSSDNTLFIPYAGKALVSRQPCHWHVLVWGETGSEPVRSAASTWTMGLLSDDDWSAQYISYRDTAPIHKDTAELYLPAARQYRKEFSANKIITRATIYATALGIYELHLNGQRVGDAYFAPGWTDYRQRAYYNTYDVTQQVRSGANALGAWVADGWYSGYVGFGLLTGMGTEKTGRAVYGKTPAVLVQLEIEYSDGTRQVVGTDSSWKVTGEGPIQAADLLMGEEYDARREQNGWTQTGFDDAGWGQAILASENGQPTADFYEFHNPHNGSGVQIEGEPRQLGFHRPQLQSFPGVPVRVTEELAAKKIMPREDGVYLFDLGQNFAGTIRLQLKEPAGQRIQIRYGEMLHPDGRLMTE
ncbi:MAG: family 78 glycoside hydrolase catalytic domain, partial [Planctomycetales bacterium]|nr:family 78 glycoside hydrolase catalytic domain [Planctomycetales bacterium]